MGNSNASSSGGIGLAGVLTAIFVVAKVFGWQPVTDWSWWWVFSPLWISFVITIGLLVLVPVVVLAVGAAIDGFENWQRGRR